MSAVPTMPPLPDSTLQLDSELQLALAMPSRPTLLLSTSQPYELTALNTDPGTSAQQLADWNARYLQQAHPERVRAAVIALTRIALARGVRLVFGAHPSISPMVLQVAQDMHAPPDAILIFQSEAYAGRFPQSTLALAHWNSGRLVVTARQADPPGSHRHPDSLLFMRRLMVRVPGLVGAVFVGGMNGVEEEARLFHQAQPGARRYAVASTGSAAQALFNGDPGEFRGRLADPGILTSLFSYSVVARRILQDLQIPPSGTP